MQARASESKEAWSKLHFAQFGLGQSKHYPEQYQRVTKQMEARLQELGATAVVPRGEGDASGDQEDDYDKWIEKFWNAYVSSRSLFPSSFPPHFFVPSAHLLVCVLMRIL